MVLFACKGGIRSSFVYQKSFPTRTFFTNDLDKISELFFKGKIALKVFHQSKISTPPLLFGANVLENIRFISPNYYICFYAQGTSIYI